MVNVGWGLAVFAGVIVAYASGAHINPAVTLGFVANGATEFGARASPPRSRSARTGAVGFSMFSVPQPTMARGIRNI